MKRGLEKNDRMRSTSWYQPRSTSTVSCPVPGPVRYRPSRQYRGQCFAWLEMFHRLRREAWRGTDQMTKPIDDQCDRVTGPSQAVAGRTSHGA